MKYVAILVLLLGFTIPVHAGDLHKKALFCSTDRDKHPFDDDKYVAFNFTVNNYYIRLMIKGYVTEEMEFKYDFDGPHVVKLDSFALDRRTFKLFGESHSYKCVLTGLSWVRRKMLHLIKVAKEKDKI